MSSEASTRSQLYWNTLLRIPVQIIVFTVSILITRALDPKDFGIMAIVMMLIGYSNLITSFGFNEAVIQRGIKDKGTLNSIFTFDLGVSVFFGGMFFLMSGLIAEFFKTPECEEVVKVMTVVFILTSFYGLPVAILRRDMNFKMVFVLDASRSLLMSFITYILAMNDFGYWSLAYGQIISLIIVTIMALVKVKYIPLIYFDYHRVKPIFHFGWWNFARSQLNFIAQHIDRFIVGRWLDAASLGFYDKALTLSRAPYDSLTIHINGVMFSSFSKIKNNHPALIGQFRKSLTLIAYINFPMYLGAYVIVPYFVHTVLGEKWVSMIDAFQIILIGFLFSSFTGILASLVVGIGKYKELTIRLFVSVLIFVLCGLLSVEYGIEGMAYAYLFFQIVLTLSWMDLALKNLNASWIIVVQSVRTGLLTSMLMFVSLVLVSSYALDEYTIINMLVIIALGVFIYTTYTILDKSKEILGIKNQVLADIRRICGHLL